MPAAAQDRVITKLGVIAGGGDLPARLIASCDARNIEVFVVGIEGHTNPALLQGRNHIVIRLGGIGGMIKALKDHDVRDLVMIGGVRRPSFSELKFDLWTAGFFAKIAWKALGDDGLLSAFRKALSEEGFVIHGVQDFADDLIASSGPVGKLKPKKEDWTDIERGLTVARELGRLDVGQAVIVQEGIILGVEGVEGTDELIRRCAPYRRQGRGGILVKVCKPDQDRDLDLPTIGPATVITAIECGLEGIVVQAGQSLMLEPDKIAELADMNKIFVYAHAVES